MAATALMHSVTDVMNLATLYRSPPKRFCHQEHHATKTGLSQGNDTPTTKGTDDTTPSMGTYMEDISIDHNHATVPTVTGAAAVS